ncbi:hypothetical protein AMD27_11135 [Acinetobacter sp. TGL-Y2]|nr:hypothetical protein AMD27_11135 [Acinetobacter sp. TGL-Y2]
MNKDVEKQLEDLFLQALHEPAYRAEFLEKLMSAHIYFPGTTGRSDVSQIQESYLDENTPVQIKSWPNEAYGQIIPFFTSLEKMRLALNPDEKFICMPCNVFFAMTQGSLLILNPESDATKEFTPEEILQLLAGNNSDQTESYTVEEDTQVMVEQPEQRPDFLLDQLSKSLSQYPEVDSAYFAQMYNSAKDQTPSFVIGLLFGDVLETEKLNRLHSMIGQVANDSLELKTSIDLLHIDPQQGDEGLHHYFLNETEAFYVRQKPQKRGLFAKLFS